MSNDVDVGIVIGGAVSAALRSSIKDASKSVGQLGKEIEEAGRKGQLIEGFNRTKEAAKAASAAYFANKKRVDELKRAIAAAGQPVKAFERELAATQRALDRSKRALDAQTKRVGDYRKQLQGASIDVKNLASEQSRLAAESERLSRVRASVSRSEQAASQRNAVRGESLGFAGEAAAFGFTVKQALDPAVKFEASLKKIEARVNFPTPDGIVNLRNELEALSEQTGIATEELANTAALAGQFGIEGPQIADFVRQVTQVGIAFDMSSAQAAESISTLSTVLSIPINETGKLLDAINQLANNSKASESQILDVLGRVGGIGRQFGLVDTQIAALSSTFLSLGKSPEVAATAINALLNKLQTAGVQSDDFQQELKNLVGDVDAFTKSMDTDAQGALDNFLAKLGELDSRGQAEAITVLFGQEYADDISVLSGSLGEYRKQLAAVSDETEYAGSVQREFQRFNSGAAVEAAKAATAINNAFAQLGAAALPVITKVSKQIASLAQWLKSTGEIGQNALLGIVYLLGGGLLLKGVRLLGRLLFTEVAAAFTTIDKVATRVLGQSLVTVAARGFGGMATAAKTAAGKVTTALGTIPVAAQAALRGLSLIGSFFVGWEIGTYLREQFVEVERAGIALASGLHTSFVRIKGYAQEQFEALKFAMTNPLDYVRTKFATFARDLGTLISKVPRFGEAAGNALRSAADTIMPGGADAQEFQKRQKEIRDQTAAEVKQIQDGYFDLWEMAGQNADKTKAANEESGESHKDLAEAVKKSQQAMTQETETGTKQRIAQAAKETAEVKKAKKEQAALLKEVRDRTKGIAGEKFATEKEPTFNRASDLTVKARQSLVSKDYVQALKFAEQATQVLEELQQAGDKNTKALAGQAKMAQQIAEQAFAAIGTSGKDGVAATKDVSVKPVLDAAAATQVQGEVAALAESLKASLVIPVSTVASKAPNYYQDGNSFSQFPEQGFAAGGFTGFGGRLEPAGIVHRGEYVLPQSVVREPGAVSVLSAMRVKGVAAVLEQARRNWGGYDIGGLVGGLASPALPGLPQSAVSGNPDFPHLGTIDFNLGGRSLQAYATPSMAEEIRREARKHGRRRS
ncbi:phage tail tape measure protein [Pseudomonas sp. BN414]|uniref:phage tail tape measure protein n=1 Tax=Pseudomonas sp. BN414 TaxID=2567888 RepID=UPI002456152B|nr:phage tail tape measure protein [Pseudomonas sp. BN414]MDH4566184.1 phage tail tape measure protein [Pseudomonas sp. BN414]